MIISMQGNWTISVKSIEAAFAQRYIVSGASSGNGTYDAILNSDPVTVTGTQWSIVILNDPGNGFRLSDTRIKFPLISGGQFIFDIQSNDAGSDKDFNDLVLSCTSPALITDYLIYGNVNLYSNHCLINPCIRRWVVIDTYKKLLDALKIDKLKEIITILYPERIPPFNPNPPDPPDFFTPIMINLTDEVQLPQKTVDVYNRVNTPSTDFLNKSASNNESNLLTNFKLDRTVSLSTQHIKNSIAENYRPGIGKIAEKLRLRCTTEVGANLTLNFAEYDRSISELAGGPYIGNGERNYLGNAVTDMNGNYIFRFTQSFVELVHEIFDDVAGGEDVVVQARPDIIVSIANSLHPAITLFESAPYFNVPQIKRIDFCLPLEKVSPTSLCFNGNLIGSLGNIFIGGSQNINGSLSAVALDRNGYNNHLNSKGIITVHNSMAGFNVDCACWGSLIDVKGCMYNLQRKMNDPLVRYYTIRYKKPGGSWQFVSEAYKHPKFSKRFIPLYDGDLVGPFPTNLNVDGGGLQNVSAYINIQAEVFFDGVDWEFSNLDRYMQLSTAIYEAGVPGKVYFLVEGYDAKGNLVSGAKDLIALYINNRALEYSFGNIEFTSLIESVPCGLYKLKPSEINTPINVQFKAYDQWGFTDFYSLTIGKCPQQIEVDIISPSIIAGTVATGVLASGSNSANTDVMDCPGYFGTLVDFATSGFVTVNIQPSAAEGGWLRAGEQFAILSFGLNAAIRRTNGYNSGVGNPGPSGTAIYLQPK
ncbi:MAG: hypothetical protein H7320_00185 [Ferruginibacter sp.]|nr:hypothetical protein [Ferruginibacter sp.]